MREKILSLIKKQLDAVNEELDYDTLRNAGEDTQIFGGDNGIDSLSLVKVVVGLEGDVQAEFGKKILLSDEKAMSMRNSPYRTVKTLADFTVQRLEETHAG